MSIFISIASYQDPLLESTVFSAIHNADNPNNLVFGICDQSSNIKDLSAYNAQSEIKYEHVDPILSKGPCWARNRIQSLFQDEEFYLQIDSHTQFDKHWDTFLIENYTKIKNISQDRYFAKPILTCYPRPFEVTDVEKGEVKLNLSDPYTQVITYRKDSIFMRDLFSRQIGIPTKLSKATHGYLLAAGCLFTNGSFIKDVPYDPNFYFYGEEISLMLRAFTRGYSIFHLPDVPIFHLYTDPVNAPRKLHWNAEEDMHRPTKWNELEKISIERLRGLIENKLDEVWGLGDIFTLNDYAVLSGLDYKEKKVIDEEKAFNKKLFESADLSVRPF